MGTEEEKLPLNTKRVLFSTVVVCVIIASITLWYVVVPKKSENISEPKPIFEDITIQTKNIALIITFEKDSYRLDEWTTFSVNITNIGNETIKAAGYCISFLIKYPNGTEKELFPWGNRSVGELIKGESLFYNDNLEDYVYKTNDVTKYWKETEQMGEYQIWGIYNSPNHPLEWGYGNPYGISFTQEYKITLTN